MPRFRFSVSSAKLKNPSEIGVFSKIVTLSEAPMIELGLLGAQTGFEVAETCAIGELSES